MEIQERISQIIAHYNLNKNSFSKKIGLTSNTTIENILGKRKTKPSYDIMHKIVVAFPEINANWLLTGKGAMLLNDEQNTSQQLQLDDFKKLLEAKDKIIDYFEEQTITNIIKQAKQEAMKDITKAKKD